MTLKNTMTASIDRIDSIVNIYSCDICNSSNGRHRTVDKYTSIQLHKLISIQYHKSTKVINYKG